MGNPKGFNIDEAASPGHIKVMIDTATVTSNLVVVKEVVITAPRITYELGADGSNFDAIRRNVKAYVGGGSGGAGKDDASGATKDGTKDDGTNLIIENLYIRGGEISVSAPILGGKKATVPLPAIHLKDIGKKSKGASPAEVADKLMKELTGSAQKAVASLGIGGALDSLTKGTGGTVEETLKGASNAIGKGVEGIGKSLKGLFGK